MDNTRLSLVEHLTELRRAIIAALAALAAATAAGYFMAPAFFAALKSVLPGVQMVFFGPLDGFYLQLRLAVTIGLILSFPVTVASAAWFVAPGLREGEKRLAVAAGVAATVMFAVGVSYALFVVLPVVMVFLMSFSTTEMTPFIAAEEYLSFVLAFIIYGGLVFQLPLFLFILLKTDLIPPALVSSQRKLLAAVLTGLTLFFSPGGDLTVQLLLAVPIFLLFEGAVLLAKLVRGGRKSQKE
ncbi:MAG: twin-arginine translocase subunit TatC [Sporomusaceae bacterium]|nr:twin-arginine translocase subunit TatC [Sporomusaceae bacterium]